MVPPGSPGTPQHVGVRLSQLPLPHVPLPGERGQPGGHHEWAAQPDPGPQRGELGTIGRTGGPCQEPPPRSLTRAGCLQVLEETEQYLAQVLDKVVLALPTWRVQVQKMKAIYLILNQCSFDVTEKCLIAEVWCPVRDLTQVQDALRQGSVGCSVSPCPHAQICSVSPCPRAGVSRCPRLLRPRWGGCRAGGCRGSGAGLFPHSTRAARAWSASCSASPPRKAPPPSSAPTSSPPASRASWTPTGWPATRR